jgi:hypothetical protein
MTLKHTDSKSKEMYQKKGAQSAPSPTKANKAKKRRELMKAPESNTLYLFAN